MCASTFQSRMGSEKKAVSYAQSDHLEIAEKSCASLNMGISACRRYQVEGGGIDEKLDFIQSL